MAGLPTIKTFSDLDSELLTKLITIIVKSIKKGVHNENK